MQTRGAEVAAYVLALRKTPPGQAGTGPPLVLEQLHKALGVPSRRRIGVAAALAALLTVAAIAAAVGAMLRETTVEMVSATVVPPPPDGICTGAGVAVGAAANGVWVGSVAAGAAFELLANGSSCPGGAVVQILTLSQVTNSPGTRRWFVCNMGSAAAAQHAQHGGERNSVFKRVSLSQVAAGRPEFRQTFSCIDGGGPARLGWHTPPPPLSPRCLTRYCSVCFRFHTRAGTHADTHIAQHTHTIRSPGAHIAQHTHTIRSPGEGKRL